MEVNNLIPKYIPLIDPISVPQKQQESSLLVTTPEEIQRNLQAWRENKERLHIVV